MVERAGVEAKLGFPAHPHMLRHACGFSLANKGHDTRALQAYLGHRNIQHTVRYTESSPGRFKDFWRYDKSPATPPKHHQTFAAILPSSQLHVPTSEVTMKRFDHRESEARPRVNKTYRLSIISWPARSRAEERRLQCSRSDISAQPRLRLHSCLRLLLSTAPKPGVAVVAEACAAEAGSVPVAACAPARSVAAAGSPARHIPRIRSRAPA
jgi:hypothetical protein